MTYSKFKGFAANVAFVAALSIIVSLFSFGYMHNRIAQLENRIEILQGAHESHRLVTSDCFRSVSIRICELEDTAEDQGFVNDLKASKMYVDLLWDIVLSLSVPKEIETANHI